MPHHLIPQAELVLYAMLKPRDQDWADRFLKAFEFFQAAACKESAALEIARRWDIGVKTFYRNRKRFLARGWQATLNQARLRKLKRAQLPAAFLEHWHAKCCENQRNCAPAYRSLFLDELCAGKPIPGLGTWQQIWRAEHPECAVPDECPYRPYDNTPKGWSYRNLVANRPDDYQLAAARIGLGAASDYLPMLPTTRAGMELGQVYVIDDLFHDVKVNFVGNRESRIVLELGALELLSGHYCAWGLKPVRENEDGTRELLKYRYVRYLLAHLLCGLGVNKNGCTIVGEHGTATIDKDLLAVIQKWCGERVKFFAGSLHHAPIARGLWEGRPGGNFRVKAALEAHHNLRRNELALLPGQKGMDPDHAPEDLKTKESENKALIKACAAFAKERPDLLEEIAAPVMGYYRWAEALMLIYEKIADRKHHHLEGFEEAGLIVQEFQLCKGYAWAPLKQLNGATPEERRAVEVMIAAHPERVRARMMSPIEVFESRRKELFRFPDCAVPQILTMELGQACAVDRERCLVVADPEIPGRSYKYLAIVREMDGHERALPRGEKVVAHLTPFAADRCYVSRPNGEYIGIAPGLQRVCRNDAEGVKRNLGLYQKALAVELKALAPLGEQRLKERLEAAETNLGLLGGAAPATAESFDGDEVAVNDDLARRAAQIRERAKV